MIDKLEEPLTIDNDKKLKTKQDPRILKARGGDPNDPDANRRPTDPVGLSRSILHVISLGNRQIFRI